MNDFWVAIEQSIIKCQNQNSQTQNNQKVMTAVCTPPVVWTYERQAEGDWSKTNLLQGDPVYVDDFDNPLAFSAVDELGFLSTYQHDGDWIYVYVDCFGKRHIGAHQALCQLRKHRFVLKQEEKQTKQDIKSRINDLLNGHANAERERFRICTNDLEETLFQLAQQRKPVLRDGFYKIYIHHSEIDCLSQFKPIDELYQRLEVWAKQHYITFDTGHFVFTSSKF